MNFKEPRGKPEAIGQKRLRDLMHKEGWHTERTAGNIYMVGWPDLYCMHAVHGIRWIETKAVGGKLNAAQTRKIALWSKYKVPVWVCIDEKDYPLIFKSSNAWRFM